MKKTIIILLSLIAVIHSYAQESKPEQADTVKAPKRKSWTIELTKKQVAAVADLDARVHQANTEAAKLNEARGQYIKAIIEERDIDVSQIVDFQFKDGKLIFVELKPR